MDILVFIFREYMQAVIIGLLFIAGYLWAVWEAKIKPALVPQDEIDQLADEFIERHGDRAADVVYGDEYAAWRKTDVTEQGKLRRVRKEIQRRQAGE
jgi:hypothetical protein